MVALYSGGPAEPVPEVEKGVERRGVIRRGWGMLDALVRDGALSKHMNVKEASGKA